MREVTAHGPAELRAHSGRAVLALIVLLVLLATLVVSAALPQTAAATVLERAESSLVYLSANGVYARDVSTGESTRLEYIDFGRPVTPTRALGGGGFAWIHWPLEGPETVYLKEDATTPGTVTTHAFQAAASTLPRLSGDASRLLYVVEEEEQEGSITSNLYLYDRAAKTSVRLLENVDEADWSPDGGKIAYLSYPRSRTDPDGVQMYILDLATMQSSKIDVARRLAPFQMNIYSARWSPSGQWIAFQRYDFDGETASIVITTPVGTTEQVVLTKSMSELSRGMEWVRLPGGAERLYVDAVVPGGGPYRVEAVPGAGGFTGTDSILHASLSYQGWPEFFDVAAGATFARDIRDLAALRVVGGYDDGTFRSGDPVRRAQYAKMITVALGVHDAAWTNWGRPSFPDVPRPVAQEEEFRYPFDFVEEAAAAGLVRGDTTGRFKPWELISRVQLALMISRAADGRLEPPRPSDYKVFSDTAGLSAEARDAVALAYRHGIIMGKTPTTFAPYASATRGQAVAMTARLMRALDLLEAQAG
jgi:hypothetical protein